MCKLVDLRWDTNHISQAMVARFGKKEEEIHRKGTWNRLHARVKQRAPPGNWPVYGNSKKARTQKIS